jgi:hypothetical protein
MVATVGAALLSTAVVCSSGVAAAEQPAGDHDAFVQCMTDNGVPAPPAGGPPPGRMGGKPPGAGTPPPPPGVDQQTWDSARQACASLAPAPPVRE